MTREWEDAVHRGCIDELQLLLEAGADIDARDGHGQTALMLAAVKGDGPVVGWLVERGAALDHTAKYGLSALMLAAVGGHVDVVRRLTDAGASIGLSGRGAPGFAEKTALELAIALGGPGDGRDPALRCRAWTHMTGNPHFETAATWKAARAMLAFQPLVPKHTAGFPLQSIRIHVRDHKLRELSVGDRTLEAHYGGFSLSQARRGENEARRLALDVSYGRTGRDAQIAGCAGRVYELGPEPEPDDIDGRSPAVVVWHDAAMFYLVASGEMSSDALVRIAVSLYDGRADGRGRAQPRRASKG